MGNISGSKLSDFNPVFASTQSRRDEAAMEERNKRRHQRELQEMSPEAVIHQKIENSKILAQKLQNMTDRERLVKQLATEEELKRNLLNLDFVLQFLERDLYRKQQDQASTTRQRSKTVKVPGISISSPRKSESSESTGDTEEDYEDEESNIVTKASSLYKAVRKSIGRSIGSEASSSREVIQNLGPMILDPNYSSNQIPLELPSNYSSECLTNSVPEEISDPMEEVRFKVKLILVDTLRSETYRNVRQFISPILAKFDKLPNHGIFHSCISIGPWILEYTDCGLCIPRKITSKMALLSVDIGEIVGWTNIQEAVNRIAHVVVRWNTQVAYSRSNNKRDSLIFSSPPTQLAVETQRRYSESGFGTPSTSELGHSLSPPVGGSATLSVVGQTFAGSMSGSSTGIGGSREEEKSTNVRVSMSHSPSSMAPQEPLTIGNCQDFVDEVLDVLGITPVFSDTMHHFLINLRKKGDSSLTIKLDDSFLERFGLQNNAMNNIKDLLTSNPSSPTQPLTSSLSTPETDNALKNASRRRSKSDTPRRMSETDPLSLIEIQNGHITFHTHEQVDLLVNLLLVKDPMFAKNEPQTFELLKAFDRAFWIKYKSALMIKPNSITNKELQQETQLELLMSAPLNMHSKTKEIANLMIWNGGYGQKRKLGNTNNTLGCPFGDPFSTMSFIHLE